METEVLWNILAKPEDAKYAFTLNAQSLVDQSPQSGIFRALLAANGDEENVRHAAVRFNPAVLYKLIHAPGTLAEVSAHQIYSFEEPLANGAIKKPVVKSSEPDNSHLFHELNIKPVKHDDLPFWVDDEVDEDDVNQDIDAAEGREDEPIAYIEDVDQRAADVKPTTEDDTIENPWQEKATAEPSYFAPSFEEPVAKQAAPQAHVAQEVHSVAETQPVAEPVAETPTPKPQPELIPLSEQAEYFHQDIDDEIYDEIVSIDDIGLEFINSYKPSEEDVEEDNESSAQHFVFDRESSNNESAKQETYFEPQVTAAQPPAHHEEIEDIHPYVPPVIVPANEVMVLKRGVSQYDDEKLPYTFMWWLDKTRQEHSGTYAYQPYANDHKRYQYQQENPDVKVNTDIKHGRNMLDELQIQYVENIYTLNAVDDLEKRIVPKGDEPLTKEDKIIERFIKTEPHIKPPTDVKPDGENKAKRSSEDGDELITETLARIYAEQMLYSKAIAAYKKLMLKYPEKSLYFAGQIEQLEKKPN